MAATTWVARTRREPQTRRDGSARGRRGETRSDAPPWPAIYVQDAERTQTAAEARATYEVMLEVYAGFGYEVVALPLVPVPERVAFVQALIGTPTGLRPC